MKAEIRDGKKQCRLCRDWKETNLFGRFLDKSGKRYINSRCKSCASSVTSKWGKDNRKRLSEKDKKEREELLRLIREAYGNKCACCGESNPLFLTIDHKNNDGYKLRPRNQRGEQVPEFTGSYYKRIVKSGFPGDLQLLCWNCNCGRSRNGGVCPHKHGN